MVNRAGRRTKRAVRAVPAIASVLLALPAFAGECPAHEPARAAAVAAVHQMYEAARHDDLATLREVVTDDFYAFDAGARFTAEALIDAIRGMHAQGVSFEWNPGPPDVHVTCDLAWLSYVNDGVITDASGSHPTQWLESAVLVYVHGRWRIRFFHSSKVAAKG